jgi:hypothetical protein
MIGDKDPEDAYDAGDPPGVRLAVLERVVADLRARDDGRREARRVDALRLLANLERDLLGVSNTRRVDLARIADLADELGAM